jgi:hypothetical protein
MSYSIDVDWDRPDFAHAWEAAHENISDNRLLPAGIPWTVYWFKKFLNVKLILERNSNAYIKAEFENEAAYVLFTLEWS